MLAFFLFLSFFSTPPPVSLGERSVDPRNWPTITHLIADRYELAGEVFTLRVYAKPTDYYNCAYRNKQSELMAFTLLGGPFETLTGYFPRELGKVLQRILEKEEAAPITVKVRFDKAHLSEICLDQVEILSWSYGWDYPKNSLPKERADIRKQPSAKELKEVAEDEIWKDLQKEDGIPVGQEIQFRAGARLFNGMHCAFRGMWQTHWGLQLFDGQGHVVHAYLPRTERNRGLLEYLALQKEAYLRLQGQVVKLAMSTYCPAQIELSQWALIESQDKPESQDRE